MSTVPLQRTSVVDHVREAIARVLPVATEGGVRPGLIVDGGLPSGLRIDPGFIDELVGEMRSVIASDPPERLIVRLVQLGLDAERRVRIGFELQTPPQVHARLERAWSVSRQDPPVDVEGQLSPPMRVFVIDDDPITLRLMTHILDGFGAEPVCFSSGVEALEALRQQVAAPQLCFLDMSMPGLSGVETVRELRALGLLAPVIGLSANRFATERKACIHAGMDDYVSKPVQAIGVRRLVARWSGQAAHAGA